MRTSEPNLHAEINNEESKEKIIISTSERKKEGGLIFIITVFSIQCNCPTSISVSVTTYK